MVKKIYLFLFVIFMIGIVFASYNLGDPDSSITDSYSVGEEIQGYLNMSLHNEFATSLFEDSFGNSIRLIDLLQTDSRHNYSCNPINCNNSYSKSNGETTKTISLSANQEKIIGFNFNSNIDEIKNFSLTLTSDASPDCKNQLKIDLFDDGIYDIGNTNVNVQGSCSPKNYGCYKPSEPTNQEFTIVEDNMYCQRASLPEAPGFELGAWVKRISGNMDIQMSLFDIELNDFLKDCYTIAPTTQGGEVSCNIKQLTTKKKDYYICLAANGSGEYKMKGYFKDKCAFHDSPYSTNEEVASYDIYAMPQAFGPIGTLELSNELPEGDYVSILTEDYIYENYDNLSCSGRSCLIPIRLKSNSAQTLTINGEMKYSDLDLGGLTQTNLLYDVTNNPAKIDANYQKIYLDSAGFKVPNSEGNHTFKLNFKNSELISKKIEVKKGASIISINPTQTAVSLPTPFVVKVDKNENVTDYEWDFGDGSNLETTYEPKVEHTYESLGKYNLKLKVTNDLGVKSSKTFNITVGSAKDIIESILKKKQENILNIKNNISNYDIFSSNAIKDILKLDYNEEKLNNLSSQFLALPENSNESDYTNILLEVMDINLPESVSKEQGISPFPFFPQKENIDLDIISSIAGGNYDSTLSDETKDAVLSWESGNVNMKVSIKKYSANYDSVEEPLANVVKMEIDNLDSSDSPYVFVREISDIGFGNNLSSESGYYYKELTGNEDFEFYTSEDITLENLPVFISPGIDSLVVTSNIKKAENHFKWGLFFIILLIVGAIAIAVYLLLKKWYANQYENYLFKDKNDLYNMVTYIQSSKLQGMDDIAIRKNLKKVGWDNEKIDYVMKKYYGKETGLPGLFKKSVKKPLQKKKSFVKKYPKRKGL